MDRHHYYSCYFMDRRLTIRSIATLVAPSDAAASERATDLLADRAARAVEVWEGPRRVRLIDHGAVGAGALSPKANSLQL